MGKKAVKGVKVDLSTLAPTASAMTALPKGPAERAADDEGRFRRNHPGDRDRGGKGGGGFGGGGGD
eukprot:CAMPEP_0172622126 /NCGR_PEP_ID=MMETSP1068-20121228/118125_1 /TAXON_ID=35684 /ORGANISM="Pseudopedinella elastica, Strain CCMP716" /LENGTH=65 /DNA_ID=CAMNT_0013430187 /DNA_START=44 /DNA_END=238 /DNA_ORIENTATION=+